MPSPEGIDICFLDIPFLGLWFDAHSAFEIERQESHLFLCEVRSVDGRAHHHHSADEASLLSREGPERRCAAVVDVLRCDEVVDGHLSVPALDDALAYPCAQRGDEVHLAGDPSVPCDPALPPSDLVLLDQAVHKYGRMGAGDLQRFRDSILGYLPGGAILDVIRQMAVAVQVQQGLFAERKFLHGRICTYQNISSSVTDVIC